MGKLVKETVVESEEELLKYAEVVMREYVKVSQKLADRGVYINLSLSNGGDNKPVAIVQMAAIRMLVKPEPPKEAEPRMR